MLCSPRGLRLWRTTYKYSSLDQLCRHASTSLDLKKKLSVRPTKRKFSQHPNLRQEPSSMAQNPPRFKFVFTVPHKHKEACKDAIFAAGAGQWPNGKYSKSCFEVPGTGQFMPMEGAVPNIGDVGRLELVEEMRIETICVGEDVMRAAVKALKKAHPYEEPAYDVFAMVDV